MLPLKNKKLLLQLSSVPDLSRIEYFSRNVRYKENFRPYGNCFVEVDDLFTAKEICLDFIDHYELTSSNWTGGLIKNKRNEFVANISYNGRVWDDQDYRLAKEITL